MGTVNERLRARDSDIGELLRTEDERGLTAIWNTFFDRRLNQQVINSPSDLGRDGVADEEIRQSLRDQNATLTPVTALDALGANARLVESLIGRRWVVMQAAREAGASWSQIGEALGMSKQGAQDSYRRAIERQERYVSKFHDTARGRAAL